MRIKHLFFFLVAFAFTGATLNASISKSYTFSRTNISAKITQSEETKYHQISYSGLEESNMVGAPDLPIKYVSIEVPQNATNFSVSYTTGATVNMWLTYDILPVMQNVATSSFESPQQLYKEDSLYYSQAFYPSNVAKIVGEEYREGDKHFLIVAISPFKYLPLDKKLHLYKSVKLTIDYEEGTSAVRELMPIKKYTQDVAEFKISDFPSIGGGIGGDSVAHVISDPVFAQAKSAEYLLITDSEKLKKPLQRLVALKNQKGYSVGVVTLDEIFKNKVSQNGDVIVKDNGEKSVINDNAGKIRAFLREAYKYGHTQYVLLVGDSIPYRKQGGRVPTDWYYCDLNTDWNTNKYDFSPELFVGRIFASNSSQVENYSNKLLKYELNPGDGNAAYLQKSLYAQVAQMENAKEAEYVAEVMNDVFPDSTLINGDESKDFPKGEYLLNELNSGYGFASLHLHGEPTNYLLAGRIHEYFIRLWAKDDERFYNTSEPNAFETNNHLGLLTNKSMPNVVYSIACSTNAYDKPHPYEAMTMNLGKAFTSGYSQGGSVAYLGNTREGYVNSSARLERDFAKLIASGVTTIGKAEAFSKQNNRGTQYLKFTHNLIGDPEFKMWTAAPQQLDNVSVQRGNKFIKVEGLPLSDSCYVAYFDGANNLCVRALGTHTFSNVNPNACIMVYNEKSLPAIAPLKVQNQTILKSQYVLTSSAEYGNCVDTGRECGNVVVKSGVDYELEAKGKTILRGGFKVESGAKFCVLKSSY